MTNEEILQLLEDSQCSERRKANSCAVEGEDLWAMVHTYSEVLLDKILTKIKREVERCHTTARPVDGTMRSQETDDTAEDVPLPATSGSPPRARIKISVDRLPDAPEPTVAYRPQVKMGVGAWIDHDVRVRAAMKRRHEEK